MTTLTITNSAQGWVDKWLWRKGEKRSVEDSAVRAKLPLERPISGLSSQKKEEKC